jgi:phosphoesterase RecJ-like protein
MPTMIRSNPVRELSEGDQKTLRDICGALRQAQKVAISAHIRPDGDAIGSGLALAEMLRQMGKEVHFCNADKAPAHLTRLPYYDTIELRQVFPEPFDLLILLEGATPCRNGQGCTDSYFTINIDHHVSSSQDATLNWVDPQAAAVAELIYMLGRALGIRFTPSMGFNLYAALISDTGCFKYSNTSARSLFIAADLISRCGFDPTAVSDLIFNANPLEKILLMQKVLSTLELHLQAEVATIFHRQDSREPLPLESLDTEDLVAVVRSIQSVNMTLFFKEVGPEEYRVSIRSRGRANARAVAACFGGGGHQHAAGYTFHGPIETGIGEALKAAAKHLRP